jgi:tRNA-specific 2-thiouridylase
VGLSGGVDSAVAAWLLRRAGYDVTGVLMRNWDEAEETGGACDFERDRRDALAVAARLDIPLREVDFVREYWHAVFEPFVRGFDGGAATPNPDLACNRHIKFGALLAHCRDVLGVDVLATGHYARVVRADDDFRAVRSPFEDTTSKNKTKTSSPAAASSSAGVRVHLLRGLDPRKDQSYFLASVPGAALRSAAFPLGGVSKTETRAMATGRANLPASVTSRRSSAGICHVGRKRDFGAFIAEYVLRSRSDEAEADFDAPDDAGVGLGGFFVSAEDRTSAVAPHGGLARYTVGQRAKIGGASEPWFVVGKDAAKDVAYVARGKDHAALFTRAAVAAECFWVAGIPPFEEKGGGGGGGGGKGGVLRLTAKTRYGAEAAACEVRAVPRGEAPGVRATAFGGEGAARRARRDARAGATVEVRFDAPERAVTPGQALVLYDGDRCLGGGWVLYAGETEYERGRGEGDDAEL